MPTPRAAVLARLPQGAVALAAFSLLGAAMVACGDSTNTSSDTSSAGTHAPAAACALQPQPATTDSLATPVTLITASDGLKSGDIKVGTGAVAGTGSSVTVQYTGWTADGCIFDTSRKAGTPPFVFALGAGRVIVGWEEGVRGMHAGGIRRLVIPPALAYGDAGFAPVIPANATLTFDIELLAVS
jgi:FKBP-type peptidyl-prolyl cis-trans isomerase FkpA